MFERNKYFALNESNGPLKTSVSRKTVFFDDSSCLNFIVAWKVFAKSIKYVDFGFRRNQHMKFQQNFNISARKGL